MARRTKTRFVVHSVLLILYKKKQTENPGEQKLHFVKYEHSTFSDTDTKFQSASERAIEWPSGNKAIFFWFWNGTSSLSFYSSAARLFLRFAMVERFFQLIKSTLLSLKCACVFFNSSTSFSLVISAVSVFFSVSLADRKKPWDHRLSGFQPCVKACEVDLPRN